MEISITTRHLEAPDLLKEYATEKFGKAERFHRGMQSIEIVLKAENRQNHCEAILHIRNSEPLVIHVACDDMRAAIDLAIDKAERRLRRLKEKTTGHRRPAVR